MRSCPPDAEKIGLYIHVPFCLKKCRYCSFYSVTDLDLAKDFVKALLYEIQNAVAGLFIDSLYFGGGTPSLMSEFHFGSIFNEIERYCSLSPDAEITVEINPETLDVKKLATLFKMGVNRINIGVQSFDDSCLKFLGRVHTAHTAIEALLRVKGQGFDSVGIDLMHAIPGQTTASVEKDLRMALSMEMDHISCYALTFEPGTYLNRMLDHGHLAPCPERVQREHFLLAHRLLTGSGYIHYEISNYARLLEKGGDKRSLHNMKYWTGLPYFGLGPGAHSFDGKKRWWNHADLKLYIEETRRGRLPVEGVELLDNRQRMIESIMLGLRTDRGMLHGNLLPVTREVELLNKDKLLVPTECGWRLTAEGMLLYDSIVMRLVSLLP